MCLQGLRQVGPMDLRPALSIPPKMDNLQSSIEQMVRFRTIIALLNNPLLVLTEEQCICLKLEAEIAITAMVEDLVAGIIHLVRGRMEVFHNVRHVCACADYLGVIMDHGSLELGVEMMRVKEVDDVYRLMPSAAELFPLPAEAHLDDFIAFLHRAVATQYYRTIYLSLMHELREGNFEMPAEGVKWVDHWEWQTCR
jgi:hypothetical protein